MSVESETVLYNRHTCTEKERNAEFDISFKFRYSSTLCLM